MRVEKAKSLSVKALNPADDIGLINLLSIRQLGPDEVYCFSVVMCDNDVDRDLERFTDRTLEDLAPMFVGKTVISDHRWSSGGQIARIYATEVKTGTENNSAGVPLKQLICRAYMLNNETNKATIEAIEGGILKEVSVSCAVGQHNCSLCGEPMEINWSTFTYECKNHHQKGETYPGEGLCVVLLEDAKDAFELSFVAVPAQRNAGVTKSAENLDDAFDVLLSCTDLSDHPKFGELLQHMQKSTMKAAEREERQKILTENKKFIQKHERM